MLGNRADQRHIGRSEEASDVPGHMPRPPSPHNLACSVPTQWQTHLRWQLLTDAKLCSGDKCRNHRLLPTQVFNHDALLLLLAPQTLYRMKSCYSNLLGAQRGWLNALNGGSLMPGLFGGGGLVLPGVLQAVHKRMKLQICH